MRDHHRYIFFQISLAQTLKKIFQSELFFKSLAKSMLNGSFSAWTIRLVSERGCCRPEFNCKVEKAGIWKSLLSSLYPNPRYQFWHNLYLPGPKVKTRRRKSNRMCPLWLSGLLWLIFRHKFDDFNVLEKNFSTALFGYNIIMKNMNSNLR